VLLSDADLRKEIAAGRLVLDPWEPSMLQPSSIDVRLDRYFRVFQNSRYTHIDPAQQQDELTSAVEPAGDEPFVLHPGEFVLGSTFESVGLPDDLAGRLEGKALAVDTPVPTPAGWRAMGELRVGEPVFGLDGTPTRVVAATEVMLGRPCYEVCFCDGQSLVADGEHRWLTTTADARRCGEPAAVVPTTELARGLRAGSTWNHHIALARPVQYPQQDLPVDPYAFGARLRAGYGGDDQVPAPYLTGSVAQWRALLRGLFGGDRRDFLSTSERLAEAVVELAAGLGLRATVRKTTARSHGIEQGVAYRVRLGRRRHHAVVDVRPVPSRPVRCIEVAAPDGMFLAGRAFVPTHNSSLGRLGLLTHSTAGFIDPGFTGHITLELSNVANLPITLWPGMKIGQLCLFRLSSPAERPYGSEGVGSRYQGQRGPTPSRAYVNFQRVQTRR
jgi:deoxycytidine triphosphate deaminase